MLIENIRKSGIYCISNNIDNRVYIGSTNCFKERFSEHKNSLLKNKHHCIHLQNFVNKYGINSLTFKIIELEPIVNLIVREQYNIDLNIKNLFNSSKIAGKPLPNRTVTEIELNKIIEYHNDGKRPFEISKLLSIDKGKIAKIINGKLYPEYFHLFKNITPNIVCPNLTKEEILNIIRLYNEGGTCKEISNKLFKGKKYQSIVRTINGKNNNEFQYLINFRVYKTPKNTRITKETALKISKANKGKSNLGTRGEISKDIIIKIREEKKNKTNKQLSEIFNIPFRTIRNIVENKTYKYIL